jgi:hypothetical protein
MRARVAKGTSAECNSAIQRSAAEPQPREFNHGWTRMNTDWEGTEIMVFEHGTGGLKI